MEQRMDLVTLGVADVASARNFYVDGLGWEVAFEVPGDVVFIQVNQALMLSLFGADDLAADAVAASVATGTGGSSSISLAQIVASEEGVRVAWKQAGDSGATLLKEPQRADFGGYHCYFADPSGFRWEIATNPGWHVDPDGKVTIGPAGKADPADPTDPADPAE
jgi:catechol 2,3-dioxygenase-like lactoylglutathione lyase family enzyme